MTEILMLAGLVVLILALAVLFRFLGRRKPAAEISIFSTIQQLKSVGHLSVFKAVTKEIVTETDHSWGEFGKRYLSWVLSNRKMAMIFDFEIDFRYDLRRDDFTIEAEGEGYRITVPPCFHEVHIRDIKFYDEQGSKLMPFLLPDLLNGFLGGRFSEDEKNKLIAAAKEHAEQQARSLIDQLQPEVQNSAKAVLESMAKAFGVSRIEFLFLKEAKPDMNVDYPEKAA